MKCPDYMRLLSVDGPHWSTRGIAAYDILWKRVFNDLAVKMSQSQRDDLESLMPTLAWFGTGSLFLGSLRSICPKAFLLTNLATDTEKDLVRFLPDSLGLTVDEVMTQFPHREVEWDYGWGMGGTPIPDHRAHLLEMDDLSPLLAGIMGWGPPELSFVLMLGSRDTRLEDVASAIQSVPEKAEWEPTVLSTVSLLGFPHEEVAFSIKTKESSVMRYLDGLASAEKRKFNPSL